MKIRQRNNGGWCMEHNGVEAPYVVVRLEDGLFMVFDIEDEEFLDPIVQNDTAAGAAIATANHYERSQAQENKING